MTFFLRTGLSRTRFLVNNNYYNNYYNQGCGLSRTKLFGGGVSYNTTATAVFQQVLEPSTDEESLAKKAMAKLLNNQSYEQWRKEAEQKYQQELLVVVPDDLKALVRDKILPTLPKGAVDSLSCYRHDLSSEQWRHLEPILNNKDLALGPVFPGILEGEAVSESLREASREVGKQFGEDYSHRKRDWMTTFWFLMAFTLGIGIPTVNLLENNRRNGFKN